MALLTLVLTGLTATACASMSADEVTAGPASSPRTHVDVTNNNWAEVAIYVVHGGTRARLGTVGTMATQRFALPRRSLSGDDVRLGASPLGSRQVYLTPRILVREGSEIVWRVENQLALSNYAVR